MGKLPYNYLRTDPSFILHINTKDIFAGAMSAFGSEYPEEEIKNTLNTFFRRFVTQQFKRNCLPDGVSVLGMSVSPRGGLDMPSDMLGDVFGII